MLSVILLETCNKNRIIKIQASDWDVPVQKPEFLYGAELVNEYVPAEDVFDFASLDASDVVVELEGLRTALAVSI